MAHSGADKRSTPQWDTEKLLRGVSRLQMDTPTRQGAGKEEFAEWESTTSYLNTDIERLSKNTRHDVSDRTMLIQGANPVTPIRRSVSGSSLDLMTTEDVISSTKHRPQSAPVRPAPQLDLALFQELLHTIPPTERNGHFKSILANYLTILEDHELDPATDKFIITIYNQLRVNGNRGKLNHVIDVFVSEPCNEAMVLSNFQHFRDLRTQSKFFKLMLIKNRKFKELSKNESVWDIFLQKKFLSTWSLKLHAVTEDFQANADIFSKMKITMTFWDIWKANLEECQEMEQVADLQTKSKVFHKWMDKLGEDLKADEIFEKGLLRRVLKQWKLKSLSTQPERRHFNTWRNKLTTLDHMRQCATDLEMALHGGFFFSKWKRAASESLTKNYELDVIYKGVLMKKYLDLWKQSTELKFVEIEVIVKRGLFLKQFVIDQFKQRFENDQKALLYSQSREVKLSIRTLKKWRNSMMLRQSERAIQSKRLGQWVQRTALENGIREYHVLMQEKFLMRWMSKYTSQMTALQLSKDALESYTKVIYLRNWKHSVAQGQRDDQIADGYFITKFFQRLQRRKIQTTDMCIEADKFHDQDPANLVRRVFFDKWVKSFDSSIEARLTKHIPKFEERVTQMRTKVIMSLWYDRYQTYLDQERLFKDDFMKERLVRPLFDRWLQQQDLFVDMEVQANEMNSLNLMATGFTKMQLGVLKVQELTVKLDDYREEKEWKLILRHLNNWSMAMMKARRDNEVVDKFRSRWDRAHLRAIMGLWKGEFARHIDYSQFSSFDEDSFSLANDDSPTKGKNKKWANPLGLRTPQKSLFEVLDTSTLLNHDVSRESIPGSERIKRKRMEALKTHYSKVKLHPIPSPLKTDLIRPEVEVTNPTGARILRGSGTDDH